MKTHNAVLSALLSACVLTFAALPAQAAYPERPIRLIVPYTPGGVTDALARAVAQALSERVDQPVIVANHPGGGANIGANMVAKAPPDGYTLLMGSAATHAINASLYKKMPFDHVKDFAPISLVAEVQNILVVNPSLPVKSVSELIAYAKERPGDLNFGSSGKGGTIHLSAELFKSMAGVNMVHIPYKGSSPAVVDLMSGQTQVMFDSSVAPYVKAGKLRALATTGTKRSSVLPDLPTMAQAGLPGYEATAWFGILAPAGTPRPIIDKLNTELVALLHDPKMRKWMLDQGADAIGDSPEEFAEYIRKETDKWARVIKEAGITPE
ncbi:Bug family tripartite tricarboxylate transporter substrate binding protein [Pollutimonas bauzanensis]|uniref:Tripartite-type tricarboxylate transporter, receptor component TctC n=1 Tax=Pollutimonas bauzanensis TaxID=658167 RepID=A0A1M5UY32_9BURK|nr:tripartite tricarboxylate transporter substrate binding protein [Pollutimonas bauzanensis]SHH67794.1 Tripartite-type tricarboxylate transporter, receptor component TctC [Pollutimonas bauzanensis]